MSGDPESWSNEQWMEWYDETLFPNDDWQEATVADGDPSFSGLENVHGLGGLARAFESHTGFGGEQGLGSTQYNARTAVREAFSQLSPEFKNWLHKYWTLTQTDDESAEDQEDQIELADQTEVVAADYLDGGIESLEDLTEPEESESIVPELGPIVIGVPGDDGVPDGPSDEERAAAREARWAEEDAEEEDRDYQDDPGDDSHEDFDGYDDEIPSIVDELETPVVGSSGWRRWAIPIVIGGAIVAWFAFGQFGNSDEARDAVEQGISPTTLSQSASASASASVASAPATTVVADGACSPAESHEMNISSPEAPGGEAGGSWIRANLREAAYPSPAFEITGIPAGATELAIVASELNENALAEYNADPTVDPRPFHGFYVLMLTGIDPGDGEISLGSFIVGGEPTGVAVRGETMLGGPGHAFVGRDSDGAMLITVLAMCEPEFNYWDPSNPVWMDGRIAEASLLVSVKG